MQEHLRGDGLLIIRPSEQLGSPSATSQDIQWKIVTQMVEDYTRVHPREIQELVNDNKMLNKITNKHAVSKEGMRYAMRCPPGLVRVIERRFPNFFIDKENLLRFMKTFKAFSVPEEI